MFLIWWAG